MVRPLWCNMPQGHLVMAPAVRWRRAA